MLAAISAWLASQGASLILGFLANVASEAIKNYQADQAERDAGRNELQAQINKQAADDAQKADDLAVNRPDVDDVLNDMDNGKF